MSISFNLFSHPDQTLNDHLTGVRDIALNLHKNHNVNKDLTDVLEIICMAHDFGKATSFFQDRLKTGNKSKLTDHGEISACFAYWLLPELWKIPGFLIVKRHHGSMKNANDEILLNIDILKKQAKNILENNFEEVNLIYSEMLEKNSKYLNDFFDFLNSLNERSIKKHFRKEISNIKYDLELFIKIQYIYSILLSADKSQLILNKAYLPKVTIPSEYVEKYKEDLKKKFVEKIGNFENNMVFNIRNDAFNELKYELEEVDLNNNKIFSINMPTGTGKTMLGYYSAFKILERLKNEQNLNSQIIYCLPYMSIIDQNYAELYKLLEYNLNRHPNDEELLKFHSMTEIKYSDFKEYDARFCFENWQSKVVTTTFVQFFNTIFKSGKNSVMHRFHTLSNSVIILDEVQAIETKYFPLIKQFLEILSKNYNVYIILMTATMPILLDTYELIPNNEKYFKSLNRIKIINNTSKNISLNEYKDILLEKTIKNSDKSFLIVMNTVKSAKDVYQYLMKETNRKCIYLSTEIYPKLRLEKINEIRKMNKRGEKPVVVSTQLIEAGIDIDMDTVYRDFSTLDSINQTAGRANRNGLGEKGEVYIYNIIDDKKRPYCGYIYPHHLLDCTKSVLLETEINEKELYEVNNKYFKEVQNRSLNEIGENVQKSIKSLDFKTFRDNFELIKKEEWKKDIFINADNNSDEILKKLENSKDFSNLEIKNLFRALNNYRISINTQKYDKIKNNLISVDKFELEYLNIDNYSVEEGILDNLQNEIFF
ncbi:CRISPR-associated helicase Cas3 [Methanococcus vannielii SB]|uniref:CRISPR-associated helicase Cas3 n=1 Tax=Methanococcus vannielii (strain ATCC 35089 / DSM 1224 / JCM 13029 / OCM 148 / SB) TaxID=406327 RepID=A6UNS0_METVS|nr:CRISPR-associated helicase/endonuclease Cas3 [Methanococcus vannielii]ABR54142.1 CRISPR-associated helicase Cas3 [Methanococcus vannielii SB]